MCRTVLLGGVRQNFPQLFLITALALLAVGCGGPERGPMTPEAVRFETSDGLSLEGALYRPKEERPPGLILIHMLGSDRHAWDYFAQRAAAAGYLSVTYDIRGHGQSQAESAERTDNRFFDKTDWRSALLDVAAAKQVLLDAGADPENIAVVGASIGANLGLLYAESDAQIQAVVMVSPGIVYHGLAIGKTMEKFRERPVLLLSSEGDNYSASSSTRLKTIAPGYCELRVYPGTAHGTDLLDERDEAIEQILMWFEPIFEGK